MTKDPGAELGRLLRNRDLSQAAWRAVEAELALAGELSEVLQALVDVINERDRELRWHQSELEQTNAGLLALHAEIDRQRQRTAFLDKVSRASTTSLDRTQLLDEIAELLQSHGFADWICVWTALDHRLSCAADPDLEPDTTTVTAVRSQRPECEGRHRVSVPLTVGPRVLGVFDLHRDSAEFTTDDISLAQGVANRAAAGLRNANEYEREHELAEQLQRAMLPVLGPYRDLGLVARYLSATSGVHVGGDWYDAVERADGTVVLTVGDVTGHGVDAAVVMGKLQNALRAYALEGHGPATSLRLVHEMLRGSETSLFATAVVVEIEPGTGVMRWASAGHPPPLLQDASGRIGYLEAAHAPMLGIHLLPGTSIPEHERKLSPGSAVVLYTDGLIERRNSDLDAGMARLVQAVRGCEQRELDQRAEYVLREMLGSSDHDDDVCLLMCTWAQATAGVS